MFNIDPNVYTYVVLPFLIFLARICDVTIGTVRIMLVARGRKVIAPLLGFVEMIIWILVIRQIMLQISNWTSYIGFAGGFAVGNYVGMYIEEKLAMGIQVIRIITNKDAKELFNHLKEAGYGLTIVDAQGATGQVNIILTIVKRSDQQKIVKMIQQFNPNAFYSVEDVRTVGKGVFPMKNGVMK